MYSQPPLQIMVRHTEFHVCKVFSAFTRFAGFLVQLKSSLFAGRARRGWSNFDVIKKINSRKNELNLNLISRNLKKVSIE